MESWNRRAALKTTAMLVIGTTALNVPAVSDEPNALKLWTLEGELKVHSKFIYRYYVELLDGQKCALYGPDHSREQAQLARVPLPSFVRVRGTLGTEHHPGGTAENLSPFPKGWMVYMDVHEVELLNSATTK